MLPETPSDRHARQARYAPLGEAGQARLGAAGAVIVGCGAIGSVAAEMLARAGVGRLRLVDRDVVTEGNLHRVALLGDRDVAEGLPKAEACARALGRLLPGVRVEAVVADVDGRNVLDLLDGADVALDGSDNFEARHVLNEACLERRLPWVHAACLGATAVAWPILPGRACYACEVRDAPAPGEVATCETAGVLPPAVHLAAAVQVAEAMKVLAGRADDCLEGPWTWDAWRGTGAVVAATRDPACPACGAGRRRFLGRAREADAVACGRTGVQLMPAAAGEVDLEAMARRLEPHGRVVRNAWLLRFAGEEGDVTVFRDGRVLVGGTRDPARARAVASRWLGG